MACLDGLLFPYTIYKQRQVPWGCHGRTCLDFYCWIASGAAYAFYNPRILLAGFTIQGSTAPVDLRSF